MVFILLFKTTYCLLGSKSQRHGCLQHFLLN